MNRAKKILGWKPKTNLVLGLTKTIRYYELKFINKHK